MRAFLLASAAALWCLGLAGAGGDDLIKKADVPKVIESLKTGNGKQRATAAEQLGRRGAVRSSDVLEAVPVLIGTLKSDPEASVRQACGKALGLIGRETDKSVPALVESMKEDKSEAVKLSSIDALAMIGADARAAVPELRRIAGEKDKKSKLVRAAQMALKSIGGKKKG